jgi:hypothetical protein
MGTEIVLVVLPWMDVGSAPVQVGVMFVRRATIQQGVAVSYVLRVLSGVRNAPLLLLALNAQVPTMRMRVFVWDVIVVLQVVSPVLTLPLVSVV